MKTPDPIPSFFVYGLPDRLVDIGFVHVETVMARRNMHNGNVAPHKHQQMGQLTFWTTGGGTYYMEDRALRFAAPAITFMPSHVVHGFNVCTQSDAIVLSIADGALSAISTLIHRPLDTPLMVEGTAARPEWQRLGALMEIMQQCYNDAPTAASPAISGLAATLLERAWRLADDTQRAPQDARTVLARRLRTTINRHFREEWSIERYATELGSTPYLLGRAARQAFGLSVMHMVHERRLLESKRLLLFTVRSIEDIAIEVGTQDPAYFSRFFRRYTGVSPGRWRKSQIEHMRGHGDGAPYQEPGRIAPDAQERMTIQETS
ncbi:AraC family transcriptional regulator [Novacetimonas maltaceti]|uniref:HTH araC/xylS-type domain-containing protein n=1 Tax=Novacetimonas maltaceti TaxID=1203393 RepID=A0A2S3W2U6_9PROT|nr:helix-turn-helix domain-containing protein [Novacetimonas maltaceti]POF63190.1 hypothetical protein KMAL_10970 [Novacetimonas maltaceti]PYD60031.1 AraC family transcriptional regulator [Novacetimonas maltaceti]